MTTQPVIRTENLRKLYGRVEAVRGLSLSVKPNQITAFLGLNGAGKSTTLRMLLGMIRPSGGEGYVLGHRIDDRNESVRLRQKVAYVSENKQLYEYMTVEQIIRFTRPFYPEWSRDRERKLLGAYQLPPGRRIKSLSKGMRTKLALLLAFARKPELLILDEPSEGLDPVGIELMLESLVAQNGDGVTVFFSSHQISEVERIADHVCLLHQGRLVLDASMDDVRESYRQIDLVFPSLPNERDVRIAGVERIHAKGRQMRIVVSRNADSVIERAHDLNASSVEVSPVSLREIFLETVKESQDALV
jgi:ABC-2 type transport system ATP-binding protein